MWVQILITVLFSKASVGIIFDSFTGKPASDELVELYTSANILQNCTNDIELPCKHDGRRLDGSCNNLNYPVSGAFHTPLKRLLPPVFSVDTVPYQPRLAVSGDPLPLERVVRTRLLPEGKSSDIEYTQMMTFVPAITFADVGSVHDTMNYLRETTVCCTAEGKSNSTCAPIEVPIDDQTHRFSGVRCLNLTVPKTFQSFGCAAEDTEQARITFNTPFLDLSFIYRSVVPAPEYRAGVGGLLLVEEEDGSEWPWSQGPHNVTSCLANVRENGENRCWGVVQGSIPPVTIATVWFYRLHNVVATSIAEVNPNWSDDKIFNVTRETCIALYNQMIYYDMLPEVLGEQNTYDAGIISRNTGFRDLYDDTVEPQASFDYMYALRWFHIVQEGSIKMYDEDNNFLKEDRIVNLTLRVGYLSQDDNFAKINRGIFLQSSGGPNRIVDPDIAEIGLGGMQKVSDLTTSDMRKGRLFGVQPYTSYLEYCGAKKPTTWKELSKHLKLEVIEQLKEVYEVVDDVDLLAGLWGEERLEGGFVPPTLACILGDQMYRAIISDYYWYERKGFFTYDQLQEIRKATFAYLICSTEPKITKIQRNPFRRVSDSNPLVSCDSIEKVDFSAWKDEDNEC